MTKSSNGSKNQPLYANGDAPDVAVNANEVSNYAALVGNRKVLTKAQRLALAGSDVWNGIEVWDTDDLVAYGRIAGAWVVLWGRAWITRARDNAQSIPNETWTTVSWPQTDGTGLGIDYDAGTSTFTVPYGGRYMISAQVAYYTPNVTKQRVIRVLRNGSVIANSNQVTPEPTATYPAIPQVNIGVLCVSGDTFRVETYQSSGSTRTIGIDQVSTFISIDRI